MIIEPIKNLCYDLKVIPLKDGVLDISWSLDTNSLKTLLEENSITKILNLHEQVDFEIEIDNVETFDSINLKQLRFSTIEDKYIGNIVFSAIIDFNKNQPEETTYFIRVRIVNDANNYQVFKGNTVLNETIQINDNWCNTLKFIVPKNYTKDIVQIMYDTVADFNAYNKEVKSANFYYLFQAFADTLNKEFKYVIDVKNAHFINKALPDSLLSSFGKLFNFTDIEGISMEEYRRIISNLAVAYQNGGAWNYIKEVLKYFIGYYPDLVDFKNFYPWILRTKDFMGFETHNNLQLDGPENYAKYDPEQFSDRNYYNPESGYYVGTSNFYIKQFYNNYYVIKYYGDNNGALLLNKNFKKFTFIVNSDNFFNRNIDKNKISTILNILKSAYTKYTLNIEEKEEVADIIDALLAEDNVALLVQDEEYIQF